MQKPRGTRDLFGTEIFRYREITSKLRRILERYGYTEIRTPTFEHKEVFLGCEDDFLLSNKEIFHIEGGKYILRPENTASVARAVCENKLIHTEVLPLQYYYLGSFFRYERPQKGRYREFTQFGVEKVGGASIEDDLEIILLVSEILRSFGLNLELSLNYLGNKEVKAAWNEQLKSYFRPFKDQLSEVSRERIDSNPLRILDDKEDSKLDFVKNAPPIKSFFSDGDKESISRIEEFLKVSRISFNWDPSLVRGIDYYTGLIYEWKYKDLTVIAGGRYDELFNGFGASIPSLGFAIGIERFKDLLEECGYAWENREPRPIYIASLLGLDTNLLEAISTIRNNGFVVRTNWGINSIKKHLKRAVALKSKAILIYGDREREEGRVTIKDLDSQAEVSISLRDTESLLKHIS
ncbi:histidyl-tRNA synthetase [Mycoplasma haemofelis str. Langford 1]|uniref:Histidine--tRNA ligase n=1 Tax=Mycoplasma haemofelis (strain Langford 1) TaxID=941640 RepID=E8ZJV9_MYCHL|nr:histidine--tRNA ligase [Mycoplasma haemofelis]CBY93430.1 histidyl-tRNA synthetase [Mycoplasma haemofelis str. Langford 1]